MRSISDSFNWAFITFPHQPRGHWYVELFPRIAMIAGYELGTGTFINSIDPVDAAKTLSAASNLGTPDAAELFARRGA